MLAFARYFGHVRRYKFAVVLAFLQILSSASIPSIVWYRDSTAVTSGSRDVTDAILTVASYAN